MHSSAILSILGLAASASAHMKLNEPKSWFTNNSPLQLDGSDFPCKNVDYNSPSEVNIYKQGQTAPLTFIGQAVHGGGSCQISLTTDKNPDKNSVWRVIKSFHGGCPARDTPGNMGDNAEALDPFKYDFQIPEGVPAGEYTLAWTWFNHVGNREMYMQCAPATIQGSGGDEAFFNSLPEIYKANIDGDAGCRTPDNADIRFPNPGQFVELNVPESSLAETTCVGGGGSASGPSAPVAPPAESPAGGNGGSTPAPPSPPAEEPKPEAPKPELPGGVFVEPPAAQPTTSPAPPVEETPEETPAPEAPAQEAPAQNSPPADSSSPSGGFPAGTACSAEGSWNCIGGSSFQRCASGQWSSTIALASGTSCAPGISADIAISRRGVALKARQFSAKMRI